MAQKKRSTPSTEKQGSAEFKFPRWFPRKLKPEFLKILRVMAAIVEDRDPLAHKRSEFERKQAETTLKTLCRLLTDNRMLGVFQTLLQQERDRHNHYRHTGPKHPGQDHHYPSQEISAVAFIVNLASWANHLPYTTAAKQKVRRPFLNNVLTLPRARGDLRARASGIMLGEMAKYQFGSPMYGLTATALNVALDRNDITERQVREWCGRPNRGRTRKHAK